MEQEKEASNEGKKTCTHCEHEFLEVDMQTQDNQLYCNDCFSELFFTCDNCNDVFSLDDQYVVDHCTYCNDCFYDNYNYCASCGEPVSHDNTASCSCVGDEPYCQHCFEHADNCGDDENSLNYSARPITKTPLIGTKGEILTVNRLIGVEIEAEKIDDNDSELLPPKECGMSHDGSLDNGVEVQTPPASLSEAERLITESCKALQSCGYGIKSTCGLHLHMDAKNLKTSSLLNYLRLWLIFEPFLFSVQPKSRLTSSYCQRLSKHFVFNELLAGNKKELETLFYSKHVGQGLKNAEKELQEKKIIKRTQKNDLLNKLAYLKKEFDNNIKSIKGNKYDSSRYSALNLHSFFYRGTIEIRLHAGTINPIKILRWAELNLKMIDYARTAKKADILKLKKISNLVERFKEFAKLSKLDNSIVEYYLQRRLTFNPIKK